MDGENPFSRTIQKIGYTTMPGDRDDFQEPDFEFDDVVRAYSTDGYARQALDKYIELMFKSGWSIKTRDERVKEYINQRLSMLSDAMGEPISQFWKEISEDLVKFSNVFIVKSRNDPEDLEGAPPVQYRGLDDNSPVSGYFRLPPQTMSVKIDEHGTVEKYKQETDEEEEEFDPEDVIHIAYKRPPGRIFGVPFVLPVIEDIKLLRQVEDNTARLLYRFLYPLFLYQVGLAESGYESTNEEVEEMQSEISEMPIDGGLVIPERHDVDLLTTESSLDAEKYLEYFQKRVFTGLGVSETIMGHAGTSNRSTAENQSSEMRDKVKAKQSVIEDYITHYIIRELLLEGGFDPVLNPEQSAEFKFNEIDTDLLIKEENHSVYKFEHDAITHEEMRQELNMDPVEDEGRLQSNMFVSSAQNQADTDNRNDPENQHSERFVYKNLRSNVVENRIKSIYKEFKKELNKTDNKDKCIEKLFIRSSFYIQNGVTKAYKQGRHKAKEVTMNQEYTNPNEIKNKVNQSLQELKQEFKEKFTGSSDLLTSIYEDEFIKFIRESLLFAYNAGLLKALKEEGYKEVEYALNGDINKSINLNNDRYLEMVPAQKIKPILTPKERGEE